MRVHNNLIYELNAHVDDYIQVNGFMEQVKDIINYLTLGQVDVTVNMCPKWTSFP